MAWWAKNTCLYILPVKWNNQWWIKSYVHTYNYLFMIREIKVYKIVITSVHGYISALTLGSRCYKTSHILWYLSCADTSGKYFVRKVQRLHDCSDVQDESMTSECDLDVRFERPLITRLHYSLLGTHMAQYGTVTKGESWCSYIQIYHL